MADIIQKRRDTASNFTSANPILAQGEEAYEIDTGKQKRGDGVTAWNSLAYLDESTPVNEQINNASSKTTPVDNDLAGIVDSADGNSLKKLSWLNIKNTLKSFFDTIYETAFTKGNVVAGTNISLTGTANGRLVGSGNLTINATASGGASLKFQNGYYIGVTGEGHPQQDILFNGEVSFIAFPNLLYSTIDMTATRISCRVTSSTSGGTVRLGIYSGVGNSLTRVLDAGTVDASTNGGKEITINQVLTKGTMYWIAVKRDDGGSNTVAINSVRGIPTMFNTIDGPNELVRGNFAYVASQSGGAFPSSATLPANSNGFRGQLLIPIRIQE